MQSITCKRLDPKRAKVIDYLGYERVLGNLNNRVTQMCCRLWLHRSMYTTLAQYYQSIHYSICKWNLLDIIYVSTFSSVCCELIWVACVLTHGAPIGVRRSKLPNDALLRPFVCHHWHWMSSLRCTWVSPFWTKNIIFLES
jgi:hypothetical protein